LEVASKFANFTNKHGVALLTESYTCTENLLALFDRGVQLPMNLSLLGLQAPLRVRQLRQAAQRWLAETPGRWPSWVLSNHDVGRAADRLAAPAELLNAFLLLMPGFYVSLEFQLF